MLFSFRLGIIQIRFYYNLNFKVLRKTNKRIQSHSLNLC